MKKFYLLFLFLSTFVLNQAFSFTQNPPCSVQAGFTTTYINNQLNVVQCLNTSIVDSTSVVYSIWNFGDGTAPVNTQGLTQPTHTYTASGLYNICLQVISVVPGTTSVTCADSICHTIQVQAPLACTLVANFTSSATSSPNTFTFLNTSTGYASGDSIRWSFGDGTVSYDVNPTHTYANFGTYNVCLRIQKYPTQAGAPPCVSEVCYAITIANPNPCTIYPNFTVIPSPNASNVYVFTNTSTPALSTATWTFGDSTTGTGNTITHTYAQSGVYRVCMIVTVNNTCVRDTCITLVVNNTPPPTTCNVRAGFSTSYVNNQLNVVQCLNTSIADSLNTTYSIWNFGDGTGNITTSGLSQPSHTYTVSGLYNICLKVISVVPGTNINCSDSICHQVQVQVSTACTLVANFTSSTSANVASFQNTSTGYAAGDSISWTFGDGTVSYNLNPVHTYTSAGTYNVCLRIRKNPTPAGTTPCVSEVCHAITVTNPNPNPCSIVPNFSFSLSPNTNNVYVFTNTSTPTTSPLSVTWNFGDSSSATGNVVTHSYSQSGFYRVCMTVIVNNTCIRDTCITLTVNNPVPVPCSVIPRFTAFASQSQPGLYFFNNTSSVSTTNGMSIVWNFGDSTTATGNNVSHVFTHSGTFNVCMNVSVDNNTCAADTCGPLTVTLSTPPPPAACSLIPAFYYTRSTNATNTFEFINTSSGMTTGATVIWTFGDGTSDTGNIVHHTYSQSGGGYSVCMKVIDSACTRTTCRYVSTANYLLAYPNPAQSNVNVNINLSQAAPVYAYIYNSQGILVGQLLQQGMQGNNLLTFNVSGLPAGYYNIRIYTTNGVFISRFQKL